MTSLHKIILSLFVAIVFALPALAQEVSEEAERHMFRGQAAMQEATDASGYRDAVAEFKEATRLAPNWADAWFNLGIAQEKIGDLPGAMSSFKRYLALNPKAVDGIEVKALIYKLEYLNDKATNEAQRKRDAAQRERDAAAYAVRNLSGQWQHNVNKNVWQVRVSGNSITLKYVGWYKNGEYITAKRPETFKGTINGMKISGNFTVDYSKTWTTGKAFTRSFTGRIDESGNKIYLNYNSVGIGEHDKKGKILNWEEYSGKMELIRRK